MVTALLVAACYGPIPKAKRTLPVATTVTNERLFECVEQGISQFTAAGDYWQAVTRNDAASGILESGHFQDSNITGFRLRIQRKAGQPQAQLDFKGSGAYHFDLGVDAAADKMINALRQCTSDSH